MKIKELEELCEKATPGPWKHNEGSAAPGMGEVTGPSFKLSAVLTATDLDFKDYFDRTADLEFIAAARTELPKLLDWVKRARQVLKGARTNIRLWAGLTESVDLSNALEEAADEIKKLLAEAK